MLGLVVVTGILYLRERRAVEVANKTATLTVEMARDYYRRLAKELEVQPATTAQQLQLPTI